MGSPTTDREARSATGPRRLRPARLLLVAGLAAALTWFLAILLGRVDRLFHDSVWAVTPAIPCRSDFRFVDLEQLPIAKPALAEAIRFLTHEGARLIVLDLHFRTRVAGDEPVAAAIRESGRVVLGFRVRQPGGDVEVQLPAPGIDPLDKGFLDVPVDPDGRVRRVRLYQRIDEVLYRSLAFTAFLRSVHGSAMRDDGARAHLLHPDRVAGVPGVCHEDGEVEFPAACSFDPGHAVPLSQLTRLDDRRLFAERRTFRDATVFLGFVASAGDHDRFRTVAIMPPEGTTPGVFLHAAILQSLLAGRMPRLLPTSGTVILTVLASLCGVLLGRHRSDGRLALLGLLLLAVVAASALSQVLFQVLAPPVVISAGGIAGYLLGRREPTRRPEATPIPGLAPIGPALVPEDGTCRHDGLDPTVHDGNAGIASSVCRSPVAKTLAPSAQVRSPAEPPVAADPVPIETPTTHDGTTADGPSTQEDLVRMMTGGRYGSLTLHAQGGMGALYKGRDLRLDTPVAVKFLLEQLARSLPWVRRRFQREGKLQALLHGVGLPVPLDMHLDCQQPFVVMEWIDGHDLDRLQKRVGGVGVAEAKRIATDLARMMLLVHRVGICHRDLKPSNLLLDRTGRLRLIDLGLGRGKDDAPVTQVPGPLGTYGYMSPEQENGDPGVNVDLLTDVYSFGAILQKLLTDATPWRGRRLSPAEFYVYPAPVALWKPTVPLDLVELISRCLSPVPTDRPCFATVVRFLSRPPDSVATPWNTIVDQLSGLEGGLAADSSELVGSDLDRLASLCTGMLSQGESRWARVMDQVFSLNYTARRTGNERMLKSAHLRVRRLLDGFRVRVSEQVLKVLAWIPGTTGNIDPAVEKRTIDTPYPATTKAVLQTLVRTMILDHPGWAFCSVRVDLTSGEGATGFTLTAAVSGARTAESGVLVSWRKQVTDCLRALGGRLLAESPEGCSLQLPGGFVIPSRPSAEAGRSGGGA
ncbi:MAG: CHASE2 domain-containing protein [Candidatus Riflebacteria bacterium]|nr:CHASE2 domain-containing protein [Candidatus Riflebacteria bacterium]